MKKRIGAFLVTLSMMFVGLAVTAPVEAQAAGSGWCDASATRLGRTGWFWIKVPSIAATGARDCVMWEGARSDAVRAVQASVGVCENLLGGSVDGIWGPLTTAALRKMQSVYGATVDGEYGPQTHNRIVFSDTFVPSVPTAYDCEYDGII